jgi:hypothetical protein
MALIGSIVPLLMEKEGYGFGKNIATIRNVFSLGRL